MKLYCGHFYPELESKFQKIFQAEVQSRTEPLKQQILVVVPTGALRRRLLQVLHASGSPNLYSVRITSLYRLAIDIVLDTLTSPTKIIGDALSWPFILYRIAKQYGFSRFESFRTCQSLYQTIRDLIDGSISPEILRGVIDDARQDQDLSSEFDPEDMTFLARMYEAFCSVVKAENAFNPHTAASSAIVSTEEWVRQKNICATFIYGFYDATQSQFDLIEKILRTMHEGKYPSHVFFPFPISAAKHVEHPAQYSQDFFDMTYSLCTSLGGNLEPSRGPSHPTLERLLFTNPEEQELQQLREASSIQFLSCAGTYDEAWAVAKKILHLVRTEGVTFDQIMVVSRSHEEYRIPLEHVFRENRIPSTLQRETALSALPFARFAHLILQAREAGMTASLLSEFLSSPFTNRFRLWGRAVQELLDTLFIKNWHDWSRLTPLLTATELPDIFESAGEQDWRLESYKQVAGTLLQIKAFLSEIPDQASPAAFADCLLSVFSQLGYSQADKVGTHGPVLALLARVRSSSHFDGPEVALSQFIDIFEAYLNTTPYSAETDAGPKVLVGDIMQLRGVTADYVFLIGLNKDTFPRQSVEDPFLPDSARTALRSLTGAGPAPKRSDAQMRLIPLKEGSAEEILLFGLALRSASKKLWLSSQRADARGRKQSCSIYYDEALRLLTGETSSYHLNPNNAGPIMAKIPRSHERKFQSEALPSLAECTTLPALFPANQVSGRLHNVSPEYIAGVRDFARQLNSPQLPEAFAVDGVFTDVQALHESASLRQPLRLSYSRLKKYAECPFSFFAGQIMRLKGSPWDASESNHDLDALTRGRMSESVVKAAIRLIRDRAFGIEQAVDEAATEVYAKYQGYLPDILLNQYIEKFRIAALRLLVHLQGYDFKTAETPEWGEYDGEALLFQNNGIDVVSYGIPDLIFSGRKPLIGDTKWGSKSTTGTNHQMILSGEFQFCLYPQFEAARKSAKKLYPFRYFRLNAFLEYDTPEVLRQKLAVLGRSSDIEAMMRVYGSGLDTDEQMESLEELKELLKPMTEGNFRILKNPGDSWSVCSRCDFKQVCRRTHTATLLRVKTGDLS